MKDCCRQKGAGTRKLCQVKKVGYYKVMFLTGTGGSVRQVTSQVLLRWHLTDWLRISGWDRPIMTKSGFGDMGLNISDLSLDPRFLTAWVWLRWNASWAKKLSITITDRNQKRLWNYQGSKGHCIPAPRLAQMRCLEKSIKNMSMDTWCKFHENNL